jgi:hypothetical protein
VPDDGARLKSEARHSFGYAVKRCEFLWISSENPIPVVGKPCGILSQPIVAHTIAISVSLPQNKCSKCDKMADYVLEAVSVDRVKYI